MNPASTDPDFVESLLSPPVGRPFQLMPQLLRDTPTLAGECVSATTMIKTAAAVTTDERRARVDFHIEIPESNRLENELCNDQDLESYEGW